VVLAAYGVLCLRTPERFRLLDSVDLTIHEAGHIFFGPFGDAIGALGGTLLQLLLPLAFVVYFWRRADRYAAAVVLFWVAQNLWNIARYIADARAQQLPLVGGGEHDWNYLLGLAGWLEYDAAISGAVRALAFLLFLGSLLWGWLSCESPAQPTDEAGATDRPARRA